MNPIHVALSRVQIRGYRSCKNTKFIAETDITALIGPNGAGKTNILHALRLLGHPTRRLIGEEDRDSYARLVTLETDFRIRKRIVKYRCKFLLRPAENNTERIVNKTEFWNFREFGHTDTWVGVERLVPRSRNQEKLLFEADQNYRAANVHSWSQKAHLFLTIRAARTGQIMNEMNDETRRVFEAIQGFKRDVQYYSASRFTNPAICPTAIEIDEKGEFSRTFRGGESDHQKFLHDLYMLHRDNPVAYDQYLGIVGKAGVNLIRKIAWKSARYSTTTSEVQSGGKIIKRRRSKTLIIPTVDVRGDELSFNQLSEGTFRALALLFYIMRGKRDLLLLEEPEVCIHHGLLDSVVAIIKEYSRQRQVILSTHSDLVVDMLKPENLRLVRDSNVKGTAVSPISSSLSSKNLSALRDYLRTTGSLGEYWRYSGFDK